MSKTMNIPVTYSYANTGEAFVWQRHYSVFSHPASTATIGKTIKWFTSENLACSYFESSILNIRKATIWSPIFSRADGGEDIELHQIKRFCEAFVFFCKESGVDIIGHAAPHALQTACPDHCQRAHFGSYRVDLTKSLEILWEHCHSKHRNSIRKAEKDGVVIEFGEQRLHDVIDIINSTMARQKQAPLDKTSVQNFVNGLGSDQVLIGAAMKDGAIHGGVIAPYSLSRAFYSFAGSEAKPSPGAMNLLVWRSIEHMRERGVRSFDFVGARLNPEPGSKYEGIQNFKQRFGAQLVEGVLWKKDINIFPATVWKVLEHARSLARNRHLFLGDIVDQERSRQNEN